MNTIIKLFRRYFLAQFIIDLLNKKRDIGIKATIDSMWVSERARVRACVCPSHT